MGRYLELLRARLPGFEHAVTGKAGDECALVDRALERGARRVVAVGGDGTWSLVADRILRAGRGGDVELGLLPAGTGNDFGKTFGITWENAERVVEAIAAGRARRIDVGRVRDPGAGTGAAATPRHFLNIVGLGFDIAVIEDAERMPLLRGDLLYRFCAVRQLFKFPGVDLAVEAQAGGPGEDAGGPGADAGGPGEDAPPAERHLMLVVANARVFGGSFRIAPQASLEDGMLDAVSILDVPPLARMRTFGRVSRGEHASLPHVRMRRGARFRLGFAPPLRYEVDGEVYCSDSGSLEIEAVPRALSLLAPEGGAG